MSPWELLLQGFNDTNFNPLWAPTWQISLALLVAGVILYNVQGRRYRNHAVFLDLNEWLLWTSITVFGTILMLALFQWDFLFVLPVMIGGAILFIWIRFVRFPPLIAAYESRLARQRYFARSRTAHPAATVRPKPQSSGGGKRRRRR